MPGTYSQMLFHIVFSTDGREPWLESPITERLYPYIGGIVRAERGALLAIGGVEDHVHLYLRWRPDAALSDVMRAVKARSTVWLKGEFERLRGFRWQSGYSVFSVSKSKEQHVRRHIAGQREHHRRPSYRDELKQSLEAHEIEFDERYLD
jgi:REP element-mobilizing transposase RayT